MKRLILILCVAATMACETLTPRDDVPVPPSHPLAGSYVTTRHDSTIRLYISKTGSWQMVDTWRFDLMAAGRINYMPPAAALITTGGDSIYYHQFYMVGDSLRTLRVDSVKLNWLKYL